jgi:hypothetical protein
MTTKTFIASVVVLLLCVHLAPAGGSVRELIPSGAAGALGIRSLDELKKKGDRFFAAAKIEDMGRPSRFFEMIFGDFLGIKGGLDSSGSFAVILADPEILGVKLWTEKGEPNFGEQKIWELFVAVAAVRDPDAFAANFDIKKGVLKPDTVVQGKGKNFGRFFYLHGKQVFFGNHDVVVRRVARDPRAAVELAPASRAAIDRADMLLHLNAKALGPLIQNILGDMEKEFRKEAQGGDDAIIRQLFETLRAIETTWITAQVDEGLGLSWINTFPAGPDKTARPLLQALQSGKSGADLAGLPDGRVVMAQALKGNGPETAALMRVFYSWLIRSSVEARGLLSPLDRDSYLGVVSEIVKHLRGSRLALYANADRLKHGLFSAVAILDVDKPEAFIGELRQLAQFAGADDAEAAQKDIRPALQELVDKLGSGRYAERESAALRLRLAGEVALPFLDKALTIPDPEVRRRAGVIKERIVATVKERRKELLAPENLRPVHLLFGFAKPKELDGQRVEVMRIKLSEKRAETVLRDLLGPDGDRIRLAVHGKQVVVAFGSDQDLLRSALQNLKEGKKCLADVGQVALAEQHLNPARAMEFDVSLAAALALWNATDLTRPGELPTSLSSFALTASPELLQFDVWVPAADFKIIRRTLVGF